MVLTHYTWIFVLSIFTAFIGAFGIGANDLANSFATSVSAKALTITQAILVAAVCEFLGAILLGAGVTDTIRSNIANVSLYTNSPALLLYGMFCVQIAAAFWDNFSCHLELPVSTTHTTVAGVIGMSLVLYGGSSVVWLKHTSTFIYITGFVPVVLSWIVSPILSGIIVTILYGLIRTFVLRSKHSFRRAFYLLPFLVALTLFVITVFIIQTGAKNKQFKNNNLPDGKIIWISITVAAGCGLITLFLVMPYLRKKAIMWDQEQQRLETESGNTRMTGAHIGAAGVADSHATPADTTAPHGNLKMDAEKGMPEPGNMADQHPNPVVHHEPVPQLNAFERCMESTASKIGACFSGLGNSGCCRALTNNPVSNALLHGSRYKVHNVLDESDTKNYQANVAQIWEEGETFDPKTERLFRYLQVFSAMVMSFAHGSNDVANAMGPFSAVYYIWSTGKVPKSVPVETWILALGGAGIVLGLATYGYLIMRVLGVKVVKLSNARGFCAELSTAITVVLASRFGLPVSTTQVITGALLAVGLFEGRKGVNIRAFIRIFGGWILTIIIAALIAAGFCAFGVFTPNKFASASWT